MQLLKNLNVLITGGSSGIGRAIAVKFAQQGANVAIFATNVQRGQEVVDEIMQLAPSQKVRFFQVDIAQTKNVENAIKDATEFLGGIDVLVNNAGITRDQLLLKMTEEEWDNVMDINTKSCFNTCRAIVRAMLKARKGKIINMTSVVGLTGNPGQVNYAASKAAVIGFTKALAKELASRNICVNCIAPGYIETPMTEAMGLSSDQKKELLEKIPLGKMGNPQDIANAALFLASAMSDYITGHILTVDGGMVMQ